MRRTFPPMTKNPRRDPAAEPELEPKREPEEEKYLLTVTVRGRGGSSKWKFTVPRAKVLAPDYPCEVFRDLVKAHEYFMPKPDEKEPG